MHLPPLGFSGINADMILILYEVALQVSPTEDPYDPIVRAEYLRAFKDLFPLIVSCKKLYHTFSNNAWFIMRPVLFGLHGGSIDAVHALLRLVVDFGHLAFYPGGPTPHTFSEPSEKSIMRLLQHPGLRDVAEWAHVLEMTAVAYRVMSLANELCVAARAAIGH